MNLKNIVHTLSGIFLLLVIFASRGKAQDQSPASWRFSAKKIDSKTFEVRLRATIAPPWHIYAQEIPEGTAMPTAINFNKNPLVTLQGKPVEDGKAEEKMEDGVLLKYYSSQVEFIQVVQLKAEVKTTLTGMISYMTCTDERCLPPVDKQFAVTLDGRN